MRTREARLLAEWSARRIGYSIRFWTKYLRLVVDWTVALYIVIPGLALLTYSVVQYYRGAWTKGLSPATIILPHIPLAVLVDGLLLILLFLYHLVSYGGVTWPLNSGDRLFLLLSPVRRWSVLTTLWGENFCVCLAWFAFVGVVGTPIMWVLGVPTIRWVALMLLLAAYTATVRIISRGLSPQGAGGWLRWGVFQLFRVVTALPGMMVASRLLLTQDIRWLWAFAVVIGTGLAVAVPMLAMRSWETYYDMGAVRSLKNLALPADMESRSQLHPWMKRPSQWLVGGVERLLHRPLQPMVWWILLRSLRRQGTLRDLWLLTMAALTSAFGPPWFAIKMVCVAFWVFMAFEWWGFCIRPLYESAIQQQQVVDPWQLKLPAERMRLGFALGLGVLWLVLWAGLRWLGR